MPVNERERRTAQQCRADLPPVSDNRGKLRLRAGVEARSHQLVGGVTDPRGGDGYGGSGSDSGEGA